MVGSVEEEEDGGVCEKEEDTMERWRSRSKSRSKSSAEKTTAAMDTKMGQPYKCGCKWRTVMCEK